MKLVHQHIRNALKAGRIIVAPSWSPEDIRAAGLRVHLDRRVMVPNPAYRHRPDDPDSPIVDADDPPDDLYLPEEIPEAGHVLNPGDAILASTVERFALPPDLELTLDGRSSLARLFIGIHQASRIIDGTGDRACPISITLEVRNDSPFAVRLRAGSPIAMVQFEQLSGRVPKALRTSKQYAGQAGPTAPRRRPIAATETGRSTVPPSAKTTPAAARKCSARPRRLSPAR